MNIRKSFRESRKQLKSTKALTLAAMLLAIAVILGFFTIQFTDYIKISFAFLADGLCGMLLGPFVGIIQGCLCDIIKYFIHPTGPYFPGFTISEALTGLVYGLLLYKKPLKIGRIIAANSIVTFGINILLNTFWLTLLYGNAFLVILPVRVIKELILLPINIVLFYGISRILGQTKVIQKIIQQNG